MIKSSTIIFSLAFIFILNFLAPHSATGQKKNQTENQVVQFDDARPSVWDPRFESVDIVSSADGTIQKAMMYASKSKTAKPLIISLHTWSGDYTQKDPLAKEILARDWNYIHPDFRGPNTTPESTGSERVIWDIEDAIQFALDNTSADPDDVHIVGVSGGGFATLAAYMNIKYPVKSFSAWAPISDLEAWYWESVGRKQKYANDIINAVSGNGSFNREEAIKRSPLYQDFPEERRKNAKLFIYEGVHDGYTGSVPITHAIHMYNRLAGERISGVSDMETIYDLAETDSNLVSETEIISLLTKRLNPEPHSKIFDRNIHLYRSFDTMELTIFEGGHEQLPQALGLIPVKKETDLELNILTLGDSNGQNAHGWVAQVKKMAPNSNIINISRGGRCIGFDNNGRPELNALRNINRYLNEAEKKNNHEKFDCIIVCMGTNDTKMIFSERQDEVPGNFEALLDSIKKHPVCKRKTKCIFVTPPPIRTYDIQEKYSNSGNMLDKLVPELKSIAADNGFQVIDVHAPLQGILDYYAEDGVHMSAPGQEIIASKIIDSLGNK